MSLLSVESFKNFFKYYSDEPHQQAAIEELYKQISISGLDEDSIWVTTYRTPFEPPQQKTPVIITPPVSRPAAKNNWPITKQEMADIMQCKASQLPDELMDDFGVCAELYGMNRTNIGYFLGQCGHESAGLRYPMELASGADYEYRTDLGNVYTGDGVKFAGTGWIQVTGRYWHQTFADYLQAVGKPDPKVMEIGKTYTCNKYPWSISGHWWNCNDMNAYTNGNPPIDRVGQRVNGRYLPIGFEDRRNYSWRAFEVLRLPYPGN